MEGLLTGKRPGCATGGCHPASMPVLCPQSPVLAPFSPREQLWPWDKTQ